VVQELRRLLCAAHLRLLVVMVVQVERPVFIQVVAVPVRSMATAERVALQPWQMLLVGVEDLVALVERAA
jgi:hypothetical protein